MSLDYLPDSTPWGGGATLTRMSGRETPQGAQRDQPLSGYRIPPTKLTGYLQYQAGTQWRHRLQLSYDAVADGVSADQVLDRLLAKVALPA